MAKSPLRKLTLMRVIGFFPIFCFGILLLFPSSLAWFFYKFAESLPLEKTFVINLLLVGVALAVFVLGMLFIHRLFLIFFKIPEGDLKKGSRGEFFWSISTLFWLFCFHLFFQSHLLPVPMRAFFYRMLGCRIGKNTFFSGIVLDPHFVSLGSRSLVGMHAVIIPHIIEGDRLAHFRIEVGDDVTIGADSIILAGVKIGSGSIVGAKSLVSKDTIIGNNELWMGTPARFVKLLR